MAVITKELNFHKKIPNGFAITFDVKTDSEIIEKYKIGENSVFTVYEDETFFFVEVNGYNFDFYSNKNFDLITSAQDDSVLVSFNRNS